MNVLMNVCMYEWMNVDNLIWGKPKSWGRKTCRGATFTTTRTGLGLNLSHRDQRRGTELQFWHGPPLFVQTSPLISTNLQAYTFHYEFFFDFFKKVKQLTWREIITAKNKSENLYASGKTCLETECEFIFLYIYICLHTPGRIYFPPSRFVLLKFQSRWNPSIIIDGLQKEAEYRFDVSFEG